MWVLSTDRAELHFFASPEDIPDEYAILSHTWNNKPEDGPPEESFQDVRRIQKKCARRFTKKGRNPRNHVSEKIRRCCELAEKHGYKWVWIDTCCIDKTSSAELSEAINSMFRYYALAAICYGYLRDVDTVFFSREEFEDYLDPRGRCWDPRYKEFQRSIWFQRGWTLQELIAPRFLVFLSSSWGVIGTKADLAELLEKHFRIPATVLRLQMSHTEFSIAQRMSWFQKRKTTRLEDEAYCLLGLFEIHMPPLYGEGRNAFRRLQEEIMKQSADTTLFAWLGIWAKSPKGCLFAASPADFRAYRKAQEVVYTPPRRTADATHKDSALGVPADVNKMTFAVTPTGIRANIPIFQWDGQTFADLYWSSASSFHRISYRVGDPRLTGIDADGKYFGVRPPDEPQSWKEVLVKHRPPLRRAPGQLPDSVMSEFTPAIPIQLTFDAPVRFPEARIRKLLTDSSFERFEIHGAGVNSLWTADSNLPTAYVFVRYGHGYFVIRVGQCQQERRLRGEQHRFDAIWATLTYSAQHVAKDTVEWETEISKFSTDTGHDCSQDHVSQWPKSRNTFRLQFSEHCLDESDAVTLSFTRCPLNPERTLILDASYHRLYVVALRAWYTNGPDGRNSDDPL
ncbi:HET-domain-containing protein [Lentinus brumalis]|uniref:HET-domain-containing protein n=1 Tax=Lentinus brumalis TaxID=2498619 RepID=A0A371D3M7_9APHY|nr:HET-domain-containing protein [Polyporus brumalis]